ncbi:MAG: hypothetical protein Q8S13_08745 [Dehalococcoidia bacterium]|nr:hypothetical protein [Dehalococcoidia bacterium]
MASRDGAGATSPAASPAATSINRGNGPFTVEWTIAAPGRITGRVRNEYHDPARRIRLLVEALDASGRVVSQKYEWLAADAIGPNGERFFEVRNLPPADHYRVLVHSWEIIEAPGCCFPGT